MKAVSPVAVKLMFIVPLVECLMLITQDAEPLTGTLAIEHVALSRSFVRVTLVSSRLPSLVTVSVYAAVSLATYSSLSVVTLSEPAMFCGVTLIIVSTVVRTLLGVPLVFPVTVFVTVVLEDGETS